MTASVTLNTFKCGCGFIYSRKMNNSEFKVGRIKQFGPIWENKLQGLVLEEKYTVTAIAREMRCDYKTVVKYSSKLGLKAFIKTKMDLEYPSQIKRKIR